MFESHLKHRFSPLNWGPRSIRTKMGTMKVKAASVKLAAHSIEYGSVQQVTTVLCIALYTQTVDLECIGVFYFLGCFLSFLVAPVCFFFYETFDHSDVRGRDSLSPRHFIIPS